MIPGQTCWCVASRDLDAGAIAPLIADPDAPFRDPGATVLKDSRTTTVAETTMLVRGRPTPVIYKRFNRKKWLDPLLNLFRPSRAWRSWQAGQHLVSRGHPDAAEPRVPVATAAVPERPALLVPAPRDLPDHRQGRAGRRPGDLRQ